MDQIFRFAPSIRPVMLPVVSSAKTTSIFGFAFAAGSSARAAGSQTSAARIPNVRGRTRFMEWDSLVPGRYSVSPIGRGASSQGYRSRPIGLELVLELGISEAFEFEDEFESDAGPER